jgi:hypothetical protein
MSKVTHRTAIGKSTAAKNGCRNKHCSAAECKGKFITGNHWADHLKKAHNGAKNDFEYCEGDDCNICP